MKLFRVLVPNGLMWPDGMKVYDNPDTALEAALVEHDGVRGVAPDRERERVNAAHVARKLGYEVVEVEITVKS